MAKKNAKRKAGEFYIIGGWGGGETGPFASEAEAKVFLDGTEDPGEYMVTQVVSKYDVKVPARKNVLVKKEI